MPAKNIIDIVRSRELDNRRVRITIVFKNMHTAMILRRPYLSAKNGTGMIVRAHPAKNIEPIKPILDRGSQTKFS
jgi:hypothetical protein